MGIVHIAFLSFVTSEPIDNSLDLWVSEPSVFSARSRTNIFVVNETILSLAYKGGGIDDSLGKVFLQFFQEDFLSAPADFSSFTHFP